MDPAKGERTRLPPANLLPFDFKGKEFGKKHALRQPGAELAKKGGGTHDVEGFAAFLKPEMLDQAGKLADVIAVAVAEPDGIDAVRFQTFPSHEVGDGRATIEQEVDFVPDENTGLPAEI